jgi:RNA polymerase sigma factor (sigma-70 family)
MKEILIAGSVQGEHDRQISEVVRRESSRLRNFIRKRVADAADAEDILQDAYYELVEAFRLMRPVEHIGPWLFRVVRNRIVDLYRKKKAESSTNDPARLLEDGGLLELGDALPSPDAGPEAAYLREVMLDELEDALGELPEEQRSVFLAHEVEGRSFKDLASQTGVSINTLLARKRYAVLRLRERLQAVYDEFLEG